MSHDIELQNDVDSDAVVRIGVAQYAAMWVGCADIDLVLRSTRSGRAVSTTITEPYTASQPRRFRTLSVTSIMDSCIRAQCGLS